VRVCGQDEGSEVTGYTRGTAGQNTCRTSREQPESNAPRKRDVKKEVAAYI